MYNNHKSQVSVTVSAANAYNFFPSKVKVARFSISHKIQDVTSTTMNKAYGKRMA